ncbi:tetratricopeptide repeat protein, partial [Micromonospora chalcea]|uniref:tetratricopeptide repeat protein n=1 Tax=Micromonospora chalcea TaxID=1874 RepID=UPI003819A26E
MREKRPADAVPVQAQHSTDRATGETPDVDDLLRLVDDLVRRVDDLRRSRQGAEALRLIEDALLQMSDPPAALVVAHGRTLLALHRPDDAAAVLGRSYELDGRSADVSAWLIASLSRGRHYDDAAALTAELCERFFGSALVRIATGRFLLDQYRFEEALPYFREAFTLDPEDPRVLRWLLHGLRRTRRFDEVEALATRTELAGMPQIEYARSQLDRYQFECVLAGLSVMADERVEVPALQARLEALRSLHRLDEAQRLIEDNLDRKPEDPRLWIELGWVFGDRHRLEEALAAFEKALSIDPTDAEALEWRTTVLRRMHAWREAAQAAQEAITRRPAVPELYLELGYLHQDQHDYERACGTFEQALAIDPKHETALEWRVIELRRLRRFDQAEQAIREAITQRPDSLALRLELGYLYDDQHDYERALGAFEQALAIDPKHEWALVWRVIELRRLRRFDQAEQAIREAITQRPDSLALRLQLGYLHQEKHDYERALGAFEQALAIDPKHEWALLGRVTELRRLRRFDQAEQAAHEAITQRPDTPSLRIGLGYLYDELYDYQQALGAFEQALAIDPKHETALEWRVTELRRLRRFDQAEQAAHEAITQRPDTPNLRIELGYLYDELYDYQQALAAFEQALAIDPKHEWALVWRVIELRRLRRFDQAEQAIREAITQRPDSLALRLELGYLYDDQHDYERALGAFEQALAIDPKHEWALAWRITELRQLRRFDQAEQAIREAITQRPDSLTLRLELGYLYDDQHDYERALGAFEQALAIDPKHEWALAGRITELRQLRRFDQAEQTAREAITQRHNSSALHLRLGYLYDDQHDYERALGAFEQALAIDPKHEWAL